MRKIFFILTCLILILGFSQNAQAFVSDGNWWDGCKSVTSKTMSFLSDKLGVKLAYAQICFPTPTSVCSLASAYHRWYLDEASGTTVDDAVPGTEEPKIGTAVGTTIIPGRFGNARNFNMAGGTGEYVNFGQFYSIGQGTVSAWIKPSGNNYSSYQAVIAGYDYPSTIGLMLWAKGWPPSCSDQWCVFLPGIGYILSGEAYNSTNFPSTAWTHLAVTYDGAWVRFYRNGLQVKQTALSTAPSVTLTTFSLGREGSYPDGYFSGGIDEVGLWRVALTGPQVLSLYQNNRSGLKVAKTTFSWPSYADSCGAKTYTLTVTGNGGGTFFGLTGTSFTVNLYPSTAYSWTYSASGSFLSSDGVTCVNTTVYPNMSSSFTTPACPVSPSADIKVNGSDGPITVVPRETFTLTWCGSPAAPCNNADSCTVTSSGGGSMTGTSGTVPADVEITTIFTLACVNTVGSATDTVTINVSACYAGKIDIGLRAQEAGATVKYAAEAGGTSSLRMFKNGTNYGIILVDPSDANASKARVQTSSGVKAFCKIP